MKKDKKKKYDDDDGRTISNMNVPGFKWYSGSQKKQDSIKQEPVNPDKNSEKAPRLTFKEKFAIYLGVLKALLPQFLMLLIGFSLIFVLLYLWLK